jgi:hypothetical protein
MSVVSEVSQLVGPALVALRRPLAVHLHSKHSSVRLSVPVSDMTSPRAVILVEKLAPAPSSAVTVNLSINGTTASVEALKHMSACSLAQQLARALSCADPELSCDVKAAISEDGDEQDAVLLEVRRR